MSVQFCERCHRPLYGDEMFKCDPCVDDELEQRAEEDDYHRSIYEREVRGRYVDKCATCGAPTYGSMCSPCSRNWSHAL